MKDVLNLYNKCNLFDRAFIRIASFTNPYERIAGYIQNINGSLLEVGCGHGVVSNLVALRNLELQVYGCDIDRSKIETARKTIGKRTNISFTEENALDIMTNNKFDAIIFLSVLMFIPYEEQERLIKVAINSLNKKGKLFIVDFDNRPKWKFFLASMEERIMLRLYTKGAGLFWRSANEFSTLLQNLGCTVRVESLNMPFHPSVVIEAQRNDNYVQE